MSDTLGAPPAISNNHSDKTKARLLALVMHALFIVLIVVGVSWQKKPQPAVQADLWSNLPPLPQPAAPKAVEPSPEPEPPPKPAPRVTPPPPPPKVAPTPAPKPDIALKKAEKEKKAEPKSEPKAEPRKKEDDKIARLQKEAEEKARREEREDAARREAADREARAAADKVAAEKAAAERAARAAAASEAARYMNGIRGKVYSRLAVPADIQGNPEAVFAVSLLPGGELENVAMTRSSGNPAYDAAIERAIRAAAPFAVPSGDEFHRNFRRFSMAFRPRS